ncbi:MAG: acetyl-CoA C-acyltransferase [Pseudomonadota bacterium]
MHKPLIYAAIRSPRARAKTTGALHSLSAQELLAQLYRGLLSRSGLESRQLEEVVLGCVTQQGEQAGNIARSSVLFAGLPETVAGLTVQRYCSSGIDALAIAALKVQAGIMRCAVAGGVEMMSRVPMLSDGPRIFTDTDFSRKCKTLLMGSGADLVATVHNVSREEADAVALRSQTLAAKAQDAGYLKTSMLDIKTMTGVADRDECIRRETDSESLAALPPAFAALGSTGIDDFQLNSHAGLSAISHIHTAGNSPAMADAAGLLLIGTPELAESLSVDARARIVDSTTATDDPLQVLTGCIAATQELMRKNQLEVSDIDLFEIHEAFAATIVVAQRKLGIPGEKLNVNGGVIALGHPMGATGALMAISLLDEMERRGVRRGIVAAAGAAGSGSALLLDRETLD